MCCDHGLIYDRGCDRFPDYDNEVVEISKKIFGPRCITLAPCTALPTTLVSYTVQIIYPLSIKSLIVDRNLLAKWIIFNITIKKTQN